MHLAIKVVIADDHPLIREGLRRILSLAPDVVIAGEAESGEQAVELTRRTGADVVLLDVNMPGMNGITACKLIKAEMPDTKVIALTIHDQEEYLFELIRAGVSAYLLKDVSPDKLLEAILGVTRGESFISPRLAAKVFQEFNRRTGKAGNILTNRELEILQLLAQGESNKSIAQKLFISEKTVKNHLTNIFQKLNVNDRTQAVLYAIKNKLVQV
ncbi:response regulator transcription factor [Desulfofundulus sp. TPOSR]|uniref:response regulator n=1 Tax=Desulfofundulus sp. TPOSR TaxID=2714340 RepID=UPI00140CCDD4|nr:response regulator transcription factor [Desulfofundulus sp. TPOSR]NHM27269.1 response regulator transcription factor [Desulfofundulus sp. TPOSR]